MNQDLKISKAMNDKQITPAQASYFSPTCSIERSKDGDIQVDDDIKDEHGTLAIDSPTTVLMGKGKGDL